MQLICLADEAVALGKDEKISIPSACYIVFERNNIPESEHEKLCSQICAILGSRGGKKSGKIRRQNQKSRGKKTGETISPEKIKKIIREIKWHLLMEDARRHERQLLASHSDP